VLAELSRTSRQGYRGGGGLVGIDLAGKFEGEDRCRQFLCQSLRTDVPGDVRGSWHEWRHPWPRLLEQTCGVSADDWFRQWSAELAASRRTLAERLAAVPRLQGNLAFEPLSPLTRKVTYRFQSAPPPASGRFRLLYADWKSSTAKCRRAACSGKTWSTGRLRAVNCP